MIVMVGQGYRGTRPRWRGGHDGHGRSQDVMVGTTVVFRVAMVDAAVRKPAETAVDDEVAGQGEGVAVLRASPAL